MTDKQIIDYKLVEHQNSGAFRNASSFHIKENYQPYGLPYIDKDRCCQVWVKYKEDNQ
jgi:hypothetical protein